MCVCVCVRVRAHSIVLESTCTRGCGYLHYVCNALGAIMHVFAHTYTYIIYILSIVCVHMYVQVCNDGI